MFSSWGKETPKKFSKEALEDMLHKLDVEIMKIKSPSHERRFFMVTDDHVFIPPAAVDFMNFVKEKCMKKR